MFDSYRRPHSYWLESRDVPATWHIDMLSSNPGSTDATITESLIVGTASVTAPTAKDAVALAISGNVIVAYSSQSHTYTFNPTSTSGTGAAFRIVGSGSATELQLEDLADMPGATPDYDYNDHTWSLNVTQTAAGDPIYTDAATLTGILGDLAASVSVTTPVAGIYHWALGVYDYEYELQSRHQWHGFFLGSDSRIARTIGYQYHE